MGSCAETHTTWPSPAQPLLLTAGGHSEPLLLWVIRFQVLGPCCAVATAREAGDEEDDDGQQDDGARDEQLPLAVIPPHLVAQRPPLLLEHLSLRAHAVPCGALLCNTREVGGWPD